MDWLPQVSQFTVFLAIAAVGFIFLLVALIFGEVFEHFEASIDHDFDAHGGPGFFSTRILSVFVTAFGGFGAVGTYYGLGTLGASGVGFGSGVFFSTLILLFARFLYGQQATTKVLSSDLVGQTARVVVAIPANGVGQVRCQIGEEVFDKVARSRSGEAVADNAIVTVEETLGEVVIVRPQ
jgi:hypothetical protein